LMMKMSIWMRVLLVGVLFWAGCEQHQIDDWGGNPFVDDEVELQEERDRKRAERLENFESYADEMEGTIGEKVDLASATDRPLVSYGVVVGLGTSGSTEIPIGIKDELTKYLREQLALLRTVLGQGHVGVTEFLEDPDTAIVQVTAVIPTGAPKGTLIPVQVGAWPGTRTTDLSGGVLLPVKLKWARSTEKSSYKVFAEAQGPIFVNPFLDPDKPADRMRLTQGVILQGGVTTQSLPLSLKLHLPDHHMANVIKTLINNRFNRNGHTVATAVNKYKVDIEVPPNYRKYYTYFTELVTHLPRRAGPAAYAKIIDRTTRDMEKPTMNHAHLSLIWEAMGRQVLPRIQPLYASKYPTTAFYAARAGVRLGDSPLAGPVLLRFAEKSGPLQLLAIQELGRHPDIPGSQELLDRLLDSPSEIIRVDAYESLVQFGPPQKNSPITRTRVDTGMMDDVEPGFILDVVQSKGGYAIYATTEGRPRLVLFGDHIPIKEGTFFVSRDKMVTIANRPTTMTAEHIAEMHQKLIDQGKGKKEIERTLKGQGQSQVVVFRQLSPGRHEVSDPFRIIPEAAPLIRVLGATPRANIRTGKVEGIGLTYGQVVTIISQMCRDNQIPAKFVLQKSEQLRTIYRSVAPVGRPDGAVERPDVPSKTVDVPDERPDM
jgi:hypothetical protein